MRISEDLQNEQKKKKKKLLPLPLRIDRKSRRRRRRSSFFVIRDPCVLFCGKNAKGFANLFANKDCRHRRHCCCYWTNPTMISCMKFEPSGATHIKPYFFSTKIANRGWGTIMMVLLFDTSGDC